MNAAALLESRKLLFARKELLRAARGALSEVRKMVEAWERAEECGDNFNDHPSIAVYPFDLSLDEQVTKLEEYVEALSAEVPR